MDYATEYKRLVSRHLGRSWSKADGIDADRLTRADQRLGHSLPEALSALYLIVGGLEAFCTIHNAVLSPEELAIEDGYLMFMEENQSVVSWGIRVEDLTQPDPEVWQRNNTPPSAWFSEEKSVSELFSSMLEWYAELGIWTPRSNSGSE